MKTTNHAASHTKSVHAVHHAAHRASTATEATTATVTSTEIATTAGAAGTSATPATVPKSLDTTVAQAMAQLDALEASLGLNIVVPPNDKDQNRALNRISDTALGLASEIVSSAPARFPDFSGIAPGAAYAGTMQPLADRIISQIFKEDAEPLTVRKLCVILSLPAEIRKNLEAMTNVADNEERRPPFRRGKRLGVVLRLLARLHHQDVPGSRHRALAAQRDLRLYDAKQIALHWNGFGGPGAATLLGLQHEAGALIEIDSAGGFRPIRPAECHSAFKCVGVGRCVVRSLVRTRHAEHTTKLS